MSGRSVHSRKGRIAAAVLFGLVALALCGFGLLGQWSDLPAKEGAIASEKAGVAYTSPLTGLLSALAVAQSAAAHGQTVDAASMRTAADLVANATPGDVGPAADARWAVMATQITTLLNAGGQGAAVAREADKAATQAVELLDHVSTVTGLGLGRDPDAHTLAVAALRDLPLVMRYAGRAGAVVSAGTASDQDRAALAVARYQVAVTADQVATAVKAMASVATTAPLAVELNALMDAFLTAANAVAPAVLVQQFAEAAPPPAHAAIVQLEDAALALNRAMLNQLDRLLAVRDEQIASQRRTIIGESAGILLSVIAMIGLLSPRRSIDLTERADETDDAADERPQIALIGARDLLGTEELVHVGRAVRSRPQRHADDD